MINEWSLYQILAPTSVLILLLCFAMINIMTRNNLGKKQSCVFFILMIVLPQGKSGVGIGIQAGTKTEYRKEFFLKD